MAQKEDEPSQKATSEEAVVQSEDQTTIKSVFVRMKPSEHRYTILNRDEL